MFIFLDTQPVKFKVVTKPAPMFIISLDDDVTPVGEFKQYVATAVMNCQVPQKALDPV